jgi:D-glycero-alpha-D-manno-heptose 1-phosphate guanylyltransferase
MIKEAIILAGGLGTRLRSVVNDIPKPMAEVCGKPFLSYILDFLIKYGIKRVILSVGYKWEAIREFFGEQYKSINLVYAIEYEPLGTGGAIKNALKYVRDTEVFILNGDTLFNIDLSVFYSLHKNKNSNLSIALKKMNFTERYGSVKIDENNRIIDFSEKAQKFNILINGGIYLLNKNFFTR